MPNNKIVFVIYACFKERKIYARKRDDKTMIKNKLSSLFLRMSAMASKFVIFTFLSKYFDEPTYGVYTLLATTATLAIFILGLDFYSYSIRDVLISKKEVASKIFSSALLYLGVYLLFIIVGYTVFNQLEYASGYVWPLIIICITEHLNQEVYRLLIAFKKVQRANSFLFFRVAGWTLFVLLQITFFDQNIGLYHILVVWMLFNVATLLIVFAFFYKDIRKHIGLARIKKEWLLKGLKVSAVFFGSTIALKTVEYSNRFIVEDVLDAASAGVFSFYSNLSLVISIYVSTIVVSYESPRLIESSITPQFKKRLKQYKKLLWIHTSLASIIVFVMVYPVLLWQGKQTFIEYWPLLILLVLGVFFMNVSLVYHSYLYIKHQEKRLFYIILTTGVFSVISTYVLCQQYGLYGTGVAFLATTVLMFTLRKMAAEKNSKI